MGKLGRPCTVCQHPQHEEINMLLASSDLTYTEISRKYGVSDDALRHHRKKHFTEILAKAHSTEDVAEANRLLADIRDLREKAINILVKAENAGNLKTALLGIREARGCIELLAKVEGQIKDGQQITIINNPEWVELRSMIINTLQPYPDARKAVIDALK